MKTLLSSSSTLGGLARLISRGTAVCAAAVALLAAQAQAAAPVLQLVSISPGMVGRPVNALITCSVDAPTSVKFTGLPPGVTGSWSSGEGKVIFSGVPTKADNFRVLATGSNASGKGPTLEFWLQVSPLPALGTGLFSGLIDHDAERCSPLGGRICLEVSSLGQFTGRLLLGGKSLRILGTFVGGAPDEMVAGVALETVNKVVTLWLQLTLNTATGEIHGTLGSPTDAPANLAPIHLYRGGLPSGLAGLSFASALRVPLSLMGNATYPQGNGYFTGSICSCGCATVVARFADNTVATCSAPIMPDGSMILYYPLYKGTGSAMGAPTWVAFGSGFVLNGALTWVKETQTANTRYYKAGFPAHDLDVVGETIIAQQLGQPNLLGISFVDSTVPGNATASFAGGGMAAGVIRAWQLNAINTPIVPSTAKMTIRKVGTKQEFTGTMITEGITSTHYGVFLRRLAEGIGHQLRAPTSTGPILSGEVRLYETGAVLD